MDRRPKRSVERSYRNSEAQRTGVARYESGVMQLERRWRDEKQVWEQP